MQIYRYTVIFEPAEEGGYVSKSGVFWASEQQQGSDHAP